MAADHIGQRRPQLLGVEEPAQPQRRCQVVDRGRTLQLVDEPQPLLGDTTAAPPSGRSAATNGCSRREPTPIRGANSADRGRIEHGGYRKIGIQ